MKTLYWSLAVLTILLASVGVYGYLTAGNTNSQAMWFAAWLFVVTPIWGVLCLVVILLADLMRWLFGKKK